MAISRPFTTAEDEIIIAMRKEGRSWPEIAAVLGHGRSAVIERARRIGIPAHVVVRLVPVDPIQTYRGLIGSRCRSGVDPDEIADEINERHRGAAVTEAMVLEAMTRWGLNRRALPPGHTITWGALTAGTSLQGFAYAA